MTIESLNDDIPIRPAATVMLIRDGDDGIEVFMLRRTTAAAFAAGLFVFPGGRVDDVDGGPEIEAYCRGRTDADASKLLGVDKGGLAFWVTAVRECFEEAGLLLAQTSNGARAVIDDESARHTVHDGEMSMVQLCERYGLTLDFTDVHYVAHWITPRGEARRFDTRFFVAATPPGQDGTHDDSETVASRWITAAAALELHDDGKAMLLPPTIANLRWLARFSTVAEAMAAASAADAVDTVRPRLRTLDGKVVGIAVPGDADYDDLE